MWSNALLAILPGLAISYYIYYTDKHEKEPHRLLLLGFFYGMVSTLPALLLEELGQHLGIVESPNWAMTAAFAFVVVGGSEEFAKFLFLRYRLFPRTEFSEPLDGIVYAVMVGMGFATLENVLYAFQFGINTTLVRMFTAVPAHAVFAVIMGYFVGLAKFEPPHKRSLNLFIGFFLAVVFHGLYDYFIFRNDYDGLGVLSIATLFVGIYLSRRMVKIHKQTSMAFHVDSQSDDNHIIE